MLERLETLPKIMILAKKTTEFVMQFQLIVPGNYLFTFPLNQENQMTTAEGSFDRVLYYFLNIWQPKEGKGSPNKIDII